MPRTTKTVYKQIKLPCSEHDDEDNNGNCNLYDKDEDPNDLDLKQFPNDLEGISLHEDDNEKNFFGELLFTEHVVKRRTITSN
jgi:hypothetical protein